MAQSIELPHGFVSFLMMAVHGCVKPPEAGLEPAGTQKPHRAQGSFRPHHAVQLSESIEPVVSEHPVGSQRAEGRGQDAAWILSLSINKCFSDIFKEHVGAQRGFGFKRSFGE